MYAVIKSGGKQYVVSPGDRVKLEKLDVPEGAPVVFNEVLVLGGETDVKVGSPRVANAQVRGTVESHGRGKKIIIYKYKKRKGYHKKQGHRQDYTLVRINEVVADCAAPVEKAEGAQSPAASEGKE